MIIYALFFNIFLHAEKMFDDGATINFPFQRCVLQSDGSWGPLSRREQRQMDEAVRLWEGAAEQGHVKAQYITWASVTLVARASM